MEMNIKQRKLQNMKNLKPGRGSTSRKNNLLSLPFVFTQDLEGSTKHVKFKSDLSSNKSGKKYTRFLFFRLKEKE